MTDPDFEHRDREMSDAWQRRLGTVALVVLGLVAFELSASPSLGVAIACLKFGWDDARDGFWLSQVDPDGRRGWACLCFYLGVGLLKVGLIAFVGAVAMTTVALSFGIALGWPRRLLASQLFGAMAVGGLGMTLATLACLVAIFVVWGTGTKFWVGPEVRRARIRGEWPPQAEPGRLIRRNRAGSALVVTMTIVLIIVAAFCTGFLFAKVPFLRQAFDQGGRITGIIVVFVVPIGSGFFMLALRDFLKNHVIARHPEECWPVAIDDYPGLPIDEDISESDI